MIVGETKPFAFDYEQDSKTAVGVAAQGMTVFVRSIKYSTLKTYDTIRYDIFNCNWVATRWQ